MITRILNFWFRPVAPDNLGICRVLFFGTFFILYLNKDIASWAHVSPVFWKPITLFKLFSIGVPSYDILRLLECTWKAALFLSCIGFFTRISTSLSFLLGAYLIGLPHNFGKIHGDGLVLLIMGVMALSLCGKAWSVDSLLSNKEQPPSGEYRWPIRAVWLLISFIFFAAGISKLRHGGLTWAFSHSLALELNHHQYHIAFDPLVSWGLYLGQIPILGVLLALTTHIVELFYPLSLFSKKARWFFVPAMFSLQLGIRIMMGPNFLHMMFCNLFWVPWDELLRKMPVSTNRYSVFFDGSCGLCQRTMAVVHRLDVLKKVDVFNVMEDWAEVEKRFRYLDQVECLHVMHVVSPKSKTYTGFYAYRSLAHALPLCWLILPLLYLPGVASVGSKIYGRVADTHIRKSCHLPSASPPLRRN
jgi:predicted DCC family thiol-disulfide oxidoreductase YuxK